MKKLNFFIYFISILTICQGTLTTSGVEIMHRELTAPVELKELVFQISKYLILNHNLNCITIICDNAHLHLFQGNWFKRLPYVTVVMIVVSDSEDLLSPNYKTLESIRLVRQEGCKLYNIFISNAIQTIRLLKFGDRYRVLDTRAKYVMLHDFRLFNREFHYIWRRVVNVLFIRRFSNDKNVNSLYELSTVPFPNRPDDVLNLKRLISWKYSDKFNKSTLFKEKSSDLKQHELKIVFLEHVPAVQKNLRNMKYTGIEIKVIETISKAMNFKPVLYEATNSDKERWGYKKMNGSFSGLLGEMVTGKADIALGNLHYTPYHLHLTDLTIPYISQCLTFLTPESQTDNSWKTLILPFKLNMWIAVIVVLFFSGFLFYSLAIFHKRIMSNRGKNKSKATGLYVFGEISNSILYTYGMLLVISLPKLPTNWSIRLLTGWYWLYCVLVVVSYRASMTAILANPAPKVTIDTMKQLSESSIECGGWGEQTKKFFLTSLDDIGQKIGSKFLTIGDVDSGVRRVARGQLAYYDNAYFLKHISVERSKTKTENINDTTISDKSLHVMKECAVHMPISIGLQKNSPLKLTIDKLLRRIVEAGLVEKWLNDIMVPIVSLMSSDQEIKAFMDLKKFYGGFVALAIGYFFSFSCLILEIVHWKYVVKRDPLYDRYALDLYYATKKNKS